MEKIERRSRTFARKLRAIVIVVPCIGALATFGYQYYYTNQLVFARESIRFHSRLEFKARELNEFFEKVATLPRSLATYHRNTGGNMVDIKILEDSLRSMSPECHAIVFALDEDIREDRPGEARIVTRTPAGSRPLDYDPRDGQSWSDWYEGARRKSGASSTHVTEPFFHKGGSEALVVTMARPILDREGTFAGVAGVDLDCGALGRFLRVVDKNPESSLVPEAGIIAYVVSPRGQVVARSDGKALPNVPEKLNALEGGGVFSLACSNLEEEKLKASFVDAEHTERHLFGTPIEYPGGSDLRLMRLVDRRGIPTEGTNQVILADVGGVLHFRIFDLDGKMVLDQDEGKLRDYDRQIGDLKKQLEGLWTQRELNESVKGLVLTTITSVVGHPHQGWWLVESVPKANITAAMTRFFVRTVQTWGIGIAAMVLIMVILGSILAHHAANLISQVTVAAASLEADGRSPSDLGVLASRNDEFGQLARGFRSMEERVRLKTAELVRKNEELRAAKEETDQAMKQQEIFLSNVAHDLRTPLTIVIGFSEHLLLKSKKTGQDAFIPDLQLIYNKGEELLELINDMLNLSKALNSKGVELNLSTFDLEAVIRSRMEGIEMLASQQGNTLDFQPGANLGSMVADQSKLWRILVNLMGNACKFTQDGAISIAATRDSFGTNDWIIFRISDTGMGMTPEQMGRLFDRFEQVHESSGKMRAGVGLGLSICELYCRAMGGWLDVESKPGKGTTFIVTLPAVVEPNAKDSLTTPPRFPRTLRKPPAAGVDYPTGEEANLVLIIDDDESVSELIRRDLGEQGYRTLIASSGEEGLRLAKQLLPSAIILDVVMPGIDGWSVLAALKTDDEMAEIPIIMASMLDERDRGLQMGADEYVSKPFGRDCLVELLQKHLGARSQPQILVVEDDGPTRERLVETLRSEGWLVSEAANAGEALERLREATPDLVVLDILLPDRNGFEVLSDIRADRVWQSIPVIVLTAAELDSNARRSLRGQVESILAKGLLGRDDLLREVRALLHPHQVPGPSIVMEDS